MPTIKQVESAFDEMIKDPGNSKNEVVLKKLGLPNSALGAWQESRSAPDDPKSVKVKNAIFDRIIKTVPVSDKVGGVDLSDRMVVKNLIDRDPILQQKYLEKKGYITKHTDKGMLVRRPNELNFSQVDPEGFDRFDILDLVSDAGEAVVTGIATGAKFLGALGAPLTGGASIPATMALGGAATGGYEAAKQGVAKALGLRDEFDEGRILQSTVMGATIPILMKGGGATLRGIGKGFNKAKGMVFKKKLNAAEIEKAAELIGAKATPGQVYQSKAIQKAEENIANSPFALPGFGRGVRKNVLKFQNSVEKESNDLIENYASQANLELGESAKRKIMSSLKERLRPAEEIYDQFTKLHHNFTSTKKAVSEFKPIEEFFQVGEKAAEKVVKGTKELQPIISQAKKLKEKIFNSEAEGAINKILPKLEKIKNVQGLNDLRSDILRSARSSIIPEQKYVLGELADSLRLLRSDTLKKAFPEGAEEIAKADKIWREAAQDVQNVFFKPGNAFKGSVKGSVEKVLKNTPGEEAVRKLFKSGNFRQIERFQKAFPEAFEELRQGSVDDILSRAMTQDNQIAIGKLNTILKKLPEESKNLIFGENKKSKIEALQLLMQETQATVRNNPGRLRDIMLAVANPANWKMATVGQITNFFRSRIVGLPGTMESTAKGLQYLGKQAGSMQGVAAGQLTGRQLIPTEKEFNFGIKQKELNFGIPSK